LQDALLKLHFCLYIKGHGVPRLGNQCGVCRLSNRPIDGTSGIFFRDLVILPTRYFFDEREPATRKGYFDFTPEPRMSSFGPYVIYEHEAGESPSGNGFLPVGREIRGRRPGIPASKR